MKKTLCKMVLPILILFSASFLPDAQAGEPHLVIEEHNFDGGQVKEGARVLHDFKILNRGDADLQILKVVPG